MSICDQLNLASWTTENNVGVSDNQEQHCEEPQVLCPAKIRTPKMPPLMCLQSVLRKPLWQKSDFSSVEVYFCISGNITALDARFTRHVWDSV